MRHYISIIFIFLSMIGVAQDKNKSILTLLDKEIEQRKVYKEKRDKKILFFKNLLENSGDIDRRFGLANDIFEEYKAYKYDSAYVYAKLSAELADISGDVNYKSIAQSNLLFCYSTVGYFKEGAEIIANFSPEGVDKSNLAKHYIGCYQYYSNLRRFVGGQSSFEALYKKKQDNYMKLALEYLSEDDFTSRLFVLQNDVLEGNATQDTIDRLKRLLDTDNIPEREKAIIYSLIGMAYNLIDMRSEAIYYTAQSAIYDITSAICETTAAKMLADYMVEEGDIVRASRYIRYALEDANTYNTQLRKLEINAILPYIESLRYDVIDKQRTYLIIVSIIITLLLTQMILMFLKIQKSNINLSVARREIEEHAKELAETNRLLSNTNMELDETNRIKDRYIIQSLYGDSEFVDKVEKSCKIFEHKIRAKQYVDLQNILAEINIKQERARMSSAFDSAFLKLFPNFIAEYNKLFAPENMVVLQEEKVLLPEMRIFALIRLGIEDINQISKYLSLSVNTIYVYKAKVKARAIVPKDEFENYIKQIK